MDILIYAILSAVYITIVHFAVARKSEFNLVLIIACFVFGAALGHIIMSYEAGLVTAIILSLVFW